jgi:protein subunit release factor B
MPKFPVSPAKEADLLNRMEALGIHEEDIEETFIRSSGKGGQHVNKTSTCVQLFHLPSGITVRCQSERSQGLNRYHARKLLVEKMDAQIKGVQSEKQKLIEKIRRQKRKRSQRAKEKILADKHHTSEKKASRSLSQRWEE